MLAANPTLASVGIDLSVAPAVLDVSGPGGTAVTHRVAVDSSGNTIVAGMFTGTVDLDPGAGQALLTASGGNDVFVAKYGTGKELLWMRRFGGAGDDRANALAVDAAGAVYFGGRFQSSASFDAAISTRSLVANGGDADAFIGSFAADGSLRWIDAYGAGQFDEVNALGVQPTGHVVAVGSFDSAVDFDRGPGSAVVGAVNLNDVFVLNLTSAGEFRWVRQFAGPGYQYPRDAAIAADGSIVVTGSFYDTVDFDPGPGVRALAATPGLTSAFIVKLDAGGDMAWAGNLGGAMQFGEAIAVDGTGAVYVSGVAWGTTDFDTGPDSAAMSYSGSRVFLAKYDASGGYRWARTFASHSVYGSFLADRAMGRVSVDSSGHAYLAGGFTGTIDFDDGPSTAAATATGDEDGFVLRWDAATGALQTVRTFGGVGLDRAESVLADQFGRVFVAGTYAATVNFGTNASPVVRTSAGMNSGFLTVFGNAAPSTIALSASTVAEHQPAGVVVGVLSTDDPDVDDAHTYALVAGDGAADNGSFTIVGNELRTATTFDYETKNAYSIRVSSTDAAGLATERSFTISVTDVNESTPDIERGLVARYRFDGDATDGSGNGRDGVMKDTTPTADRFGFASGALAFNGSSSWVTVPHAAALNAFPITVSAWFRSTADSPGHIVAKYENATWNGWGINVEKTRVQPNSASGYYLASRSNALISQYDAYPPFEAGRNLNDGAWHQVVMVIDQASGRLYLDGALADTQEWRGIPSAMTAAWPMYFGYYPHTYAGIGDANPYYSGSIDDVRIYGRALTGQEVDLLHATESVPPSRAPSDVVLSATTVAENQPAGTVVGTFSTVDTDGGDPHIYSLVSGDGAADNGSFTIVGNQLRTATSFDYETRTSFTIRVRAVDAAGLSIEKVFTVLVGDVNEAPTAIMLSSASIIENQPAGTVVGLLRTVDPDRMPPQITIFPPLPAFTYSFVSGAGDTDNALFRVERDATLDIDKLVTAVPLGAGSYSIRIRSTDPGGLFTEQAFTITVEDVEDLVLAVEEIVPPEPGSYAVGQRLEITVVLSKSVEVRGRPQLQFLVGRSMRSASYVVGSGSSELTFEYIVTRRDHAASVALGRRFVFPRRSAIAAGDEVLSAQLPAGIGGVVFDGVTIDTRSPTPVGRVRVPPNGISTVGQALDFVVRFSETVVVDGVPAIGLQGLEGSRVAGYVSGSGTPELTFRYVVQAGDRIRSSTGLRLGRTIETGADGFIGDEAGNEAVLRITAPVLRGIRIDGTALVAAGLLMDQSQVASPKRARQPVGVQ